MVRPLYFLALNFILDQVISLSSRVRTLWMLLRWKDLSLFSCLAYVVHVSLPYISVLTTQALHMTILVFTVRLGLVHTREGRQASVVAAFPILLLISVSKERLSVMVEPRYVNCSTTSSSLSSMVMAGSSNVSCPRTFVFFRLMVSRKSLQAREKQSISAAPTGCRLSLLHHPRTACLWWGLHKSLSWLWGDQDWKACHLICSADRFPLMLCLRRVSRAGQRRFQ